MDDQSSAEIWAEFERVIEEMEWEEMVSMLTEVIEAELSKVPPAELPTPQFSLGGTQYLPNVPWCPPLTASSTLMLGQEAHAPFLTLYPIYVVLPPSTAEPVHHAPAVPAAPLSSCSPARNQKEYIKMPTNTFMLSLKEQRPKVTAELNIDNSSALNKVLGERWTSLSPEEEEEEKYFKQVHQEQRMHVQRHLGWSSAHNYGKKKRSPATTATAATAAGDDDDEESGPGDLNPVKRSCRWPEASGSAPLPPPSSAT